MCNSILCFHISYYFGIKSHLMEHYCAVESCTVLTLSHEWIFATPWIVAHQALLSMEFSRLECWSGLPFPTPGALAHPGIELIPCISCIGKHACSVPSVLSSCLQPCGLQLSRLRCPWDTLGKNTGVGCHFLHYGTGRWILYQCTIWGACVVEQGSWKYSHG